MIDFLNFWQSPRRSLLAPPLEADVWRGEHGPASSMAAEKLTQRRGAAGCLEVWRMSSNRWREAASLSAMAVRHCCPPMGKNSVRDHVDVSAEPVSPSVDFGCGDHWAGRSIGDSDLCGVSNQCAGDELEEPASVLGTQVPEAAAGRIRRLLTAGERVSARYSDNGRWYPAVVDTIRPDGSVLVRYSPPNPPKSCPFPRIPLHSSSSAAGV